MYKQLPEQPLRVGLVLSAGGVRGLLAHAGFLQVANTMGMQFAAIAGCSAGGVIATCFAAGVDPAEICTAVRRLRLHEFYRPIGWFRIAMRLLIRRGRGFTGLSDPEVMVRRIARALPVRTFADCRIPLSLIAMNLSTATRELLTEGQLARAAAASAAVPVFFSPVQIGQAAYCDAATYQRTPKEAVCCRHQLDLLVVHEINTDELDVETRDFEHRDWSLFRLLGRLFYLGTRTTPHSSPLYECCPCGCGAHILTVQPQLPSVSLAIDPATHRDITEVAKIYAEVALKEFYSRQSGWRLPAVMSAARPEVNQ